MVNQVLGTSFCYNWPWTIVFCHLVNLYLVWIWLRIWSSFIFLSYWWPSTSHLYWYYFRVHGEKCNEKLMSLYKSLSTKFTFLAGNEKRTEVIVEQMHLSCLERGTKSCISFKILSYKMEVNRWWKETDSRFNKMVQIFNVYFQLKM